MNNLKQMKILPMIVLAVLLITGHAFGTTYITEDLIDYGEGSANALDYTVYFDTGDAPIIEFAVAHDNPSWATVDNSTGWSGFVLTHGGEGWGATGYNGDLNWLGTFSATSAFLFTSYSEVEPTYSGLSSSGISDFIGVLALSGGGSPFVVHHSGGGDDETEYGETGASPVPEPATMLLLGTGLIGLAGVGRKKFIK